MRKIHASKCTVQDIEDSTARRFLEENHSQRSTKDTSIYFGAFYGDKLVGVVQFSAPRTVDMKRKYTRELVRLCFKKNTVVYERASKLIEHYISTKNPSDFFTYQDTTGKTTDVYKYCGMSLISQNSKKKYFH